MNSICVWRAEPQVDTKNLIDHAANIAVDA